MLGVLVIEGQLVLLLTLRPNHHPAALLYLTITLIARGFSQHLDRPVQVVDTHPFLSDTNVFADP